MNSQTNNLLIQIGLYKSAEFQYVAFPDWEETMQTKLLDNQLPLELCTKEPWNYLGIDIDKNSIDHLEGLKPDSDLIEYRHLGVSYNCSENQNYYISDSFGKASGKLVDLNTLLEQNSDKNIRAVVLDIEGGETEIFQTYDLKIKPDFFGIEAHSLLAVNYLCQLLLSNGYSLIQYLPTNISRRFENEPVSIKNCETRWLGFLLTSVVHESAAGYCYKYLV